MKKTGIWLAVAVTLAGTSVAPAVFAQDAKQPEAPRTLPTLLIKGEVVSVDTNDPAATLLKVKDRYGFETPIYLSQETKIAQGDQMLAVADLKNGTAVEVEYNFDINTAKRHAVKVTVSAPAATAAATPAVATAMTPAAPVAPAETVAPTVTAPAAATPEAAPAVTMPAATSSSEATPAAPAAPATATKEHPGKEHPGTTTQ